MTGRPVVAICGVDFGWGSAGKLRAIMKALLASRSDLQFVVLGTRLGRPILGDIPVQAWYEQWPATPDALRALLIRHRVTAGLVVLDPLAAQSLEDAGYPTVFVDSLPYLWTSADRLPFSVSAYCAQRCPELPQPCLEPLSRIARLRWVDGIIATTAPTSRDRGMCVLNLGGLHSPSHAEGNPTYLRLVLEAALTALADAGYRTVHVCGNITEADLPEQFARSGMDLHVGARPHDDFLRLLSGADLLVTSPGLTTLLEASALQTPTVCLPPQNLSQIFNGDRFASLTSADCRVSWPTELLDLAKVNEARLRGENAGLEVINRALHRAQPGQIRTWLQEGLSTAIRHVDDVQDWSVLADNAGHHGADQVAQILSDIVSARTGDPKITRTSLETDAEHVSV